MLEDLGIIDFGTYVRWERRFLRSRRRAMIATAALTAGLGAVALAVSPDTGTLALVGVAAVLAAGAAWAEDRSQHRLAMAGLLGDSDDSLADFRSYILAGQARDRLRQRLRATVRWPLLAKPSPTVRFS